MSTILPFFITLKVDLIKTAFESAVLKRVIIEYGEFHALKGFQPSSQEGQSIPLPNKKCI